MLGKSIHNLHSLAEFFNAFGLTDRSKLIQAMFDAEVDTESIIAALKGLPEYRAPFSSLPNEGA